MANKQLINIVGFAEIVGVGHSTVSRAVKIGRLDKSVKGDTRKGKMIEIFSGCIEWQENKDLSKERFLDEVDEEEDESSDYPTSAESRKVRDYYASLNEKLDFQKAAGELIDIPSASREIFIFVRSARDRLLGIPELLRRKMINKGLNEDDILEVTKHAKEVIENTLFEVCDDLEDCIRKEMNDPKSSQL